MKGVFYHLHPADSPVQKDRMGELLDLDMIDLPFSSVDTLSGEVRVVRILVHKVSHRGTLRIFSCVPADFMTFAGGTTC